MRVMIVDDELPIREWLQYSIQKTNLPMEVCALCANGTEALETFQRLRPTLVFTDIKMPEKDGIELLQEIRRLDSQVYVVMLTSHDSFDYARRSLKYQANEYILKNEITSQSLARIYEAAEKQLSTAQGAADRTGRDSLPLRELFEGMTRGSKSAQELLQMLGGNLSASDFSSYFTAAVSMHSLVNRNGWRAALELIPEGIDAVIHTFYYDRHNIILLVSMGGVARARMMALRRELSMRLFSELCAPLGVSGCYAGIEYFSDAAAQAVEALEQQIFTGESPAVFFAEMLVSGSREAFSQESREILYLISHQQILSASAKIRCLLEDVLILEIPKALVCDTCIQIVTAMQLVALNRNMTAAFSACRDTLSVLESVGSFRELRTLLLELLDTVDRELGDCAYSRHVQQAIALIHAEYASIRRISDVSDQLNLNTEYFCRVFKQETGTTFNTYLTNYRIQIAKELLNSTDRKIIDIAQSVGYPNLSYFSRVFKSVTGVAPFRFRDLDGTQE